MSNGKMAYILCGEDWFSETALQECYWAKFELPKELTNG
jgi:glutamyl/glutaminyl-tRNA synthetase